MSATLQDRKSKAEPHHAPFRGLPPRIRALYITTRQRTGGWLAEAFAGDSASEVHLEEAIGTAAGLAKLRDEAFDVVLVSHDAEHLDALDLIEGYRAGGADEPIIVLGMESEQEMASLCFEVGADAYVCVPMATTRNLIWVIARAIQRHEMARENHRLTLAEQSRLHREHEEAERLLRQQRTLLADLEQISAEDHGGSCGLLHEPIALPEPLIAHYRELLRTYVIMGTGNLSAELKCLAEVLVTAGLNSRQTMYLHLQVLEELIRGLGARSTRHVMTRADLLVLEVMVHLAESYRQRYRERVCPPQQLLLPGFGDEGERIRD